jgi:hypothetical protein
MQPVWTDVSICAFGLAERTVAFVKAPPDGNSGIEEFKLARH